MGRLTERVKDAIQAKLLGPDGDPRVPLPDDELRDLVGEDERE